MQEASYELVSFIVYSKIVFGLLAAIQRAGHRTTNAQAPCRGRRLFALSYAPARELNSIANRGRSSQFANSCNSRFVTL